MEKTHIPNLDDNNNGCGFVAAFFDFINHINFNVRKKSIEEAIGVRKRARPEKSVNFSVKKHNEKSFSVIFSFPNMFRV